MADFGLNHFVGTFSVRGDKERIEAFWKDFIIAKHEDDFDKSTRECVEDYDNVELDQEGRSHWFNFKHFGRPGEQEAENNWAIILKPVQPADTSVRLYIYLIPSEDFFDAI